MSLEARCLQFHEAAMGTGKSKPPAKEIATLRKFLHKNQDQRFTDKAVARLFDTIQLYYAHDSVDSDAKEGLLEDALKLPFTVFGTKQKMKMMGWLELLRGAGSAPQGQTPSQQTQTFSVIDVTDDGCACLMHDETGDTFENVALPEGDVGKNILQAFSTTEAAVQVEATVVEGNVTQIVGQIS